MAVINHLAIHVLGLFFLFLRKVDSQDTSILENAIKRTEPKDLRDERAIFQGDITK